MTYHDHSLLRGKRSMADRRRKFALMREGAESLNIFQKMPGIRITTLAENWDSVGAELRKAAKSAEEFCD